MSNRQPLLIALAIGLALCLCFTCAAAAIGAYLTLAPQGPVIGPSTGEYSGYFTSGFEVSSFVPCGSAEQWWLGAGPESGFYDQYLEVIGPDAGEYVTVFVRFSGTVSPPGSYGHLGAYSREVTAETVLEMSLDGTC